MKSLSALFFLAIIVFSFSKGLAQSITGNWQQPYQKARVFIENKGQFDAFQTLETGPIAYAIDFGSTRIFFGTKGIRYYFLEARQTLKETRDSLRTLYASQVPVYKEKEQIVGKFAFKSDAFQIQFIGQSQDVQLRAEGEQTAYFAYPEANVCHAYKRLVYQNIYPFIDLEYTVHPLDGLKYAFVVHPGANTTHIQLKYDRPVTIDMHHDVLIPTVLGAVRDHAPFSFQGDTSNVVASSFILNGQTISFHIGAYDQAQTLIIDPWTQSPNFATNWDVVWECERDGAGNAYALGGIMPMQILKYNSAGTLLWTYSTPYDTSNVWLGTFAVDNLGNSYVTAGSVAQIQKISPSGALLVNNPSPGGILSSAEFWTIAFNCDETSLVIGGTGGALLQLDAVVYNVNTSTLNISNQQFISNGPTTSIPPNLEEVRAITSAPNGRYYFMTHDTIGYLNDNFGSCPSGSSNFYKGPHAAGWGYKCENFRYDNAGINALASTASHLYMHRGNEIQKRSLVDGSIIQTNVIPGGQFASVFLGGNQTGCAGIATDACGNIYVGSTTGVVKYDELLIQQAFYPTSFAVYDIEINTNGELLVSGGTGTSTASTRTGAIRSMAVGACAPIALSCCDASICQPQNVCQSDAPFQLVAGTSGGTWSGPGVSAQGLFDPSVAGAGLQTIIYTLPCGSDSIQITVSPCTGLQVCLDANGQMTVSGGVGPYTWSYYTPGASTPITNQTECQNCGYTWFFGQCLNGFLPATSCSTPAGYVNFANGVTVAAPSAQNQLQVTDNTGAVLQFLVSQLAPCAPNPCAGFAATVQTQLNPTCFGSTDGSISIELTNGTAPFNYNWNPVSSTTNILLALSAGAYTCIVTDVNNCSTSVTAVLTEPSPLTLASSTNPTPCGFSEGSMTVQVSGGTSPYTYNWSAFTSTSNFLDSLSSGYYTVVVEDVNGCLQSITDTVLISNGPQLNEVISASSCMSNSGTINVAVVGGTPPYTYFWTPNLGNGPSLIGLAANDTLILSVSDANDCGATETYVIPSLNDLEITSWASNTSILEGQTVVLNASGALSFFWEPNTNLSCQMCATTTASPITTTQYVVTGMASNGCQDQDTILITVTELCGEVYVPSILALEASNPNDQAICVYGNCIESFLLVIYNRWGEVVFETTDQSNCWDGKFKDKQLNADIFAYKLQVKIQDGTYIDRVGSIQLVR